MKSSVKTKRNKAFTLVEFLVVVLIVGILFVTIAAFTGNSTDKAKESGVLTDLRAWETAIHQVGIEHGEFTNDLNVLAEQINANVDKKLLVRVVGDKLVTNQADPWGTEYQIRYSKDPTNIGKLTIVSAGRDLKFDSDDDMGSVISYNITHDGTKMETSPLVPGTSNNGNETPEHVCVFNKEVKADKYLKTAGNCMEQAVYYYSCICGAKGSDNFVGEKDLNTHILSIDKQYSSPTNESHTTTLTCSGCETVLDVVSENHTFENNNCIYCNYAQHEHVYDQQVKTEAYLKTAATCNSKAVYNYSCQCGEKGTATFEYGEKLTHTYSGVITSYPTCTTEGVKTFTCMLCSHSYTEKIDKYAHSYINKNAQPKYLKSEATCTAKAVYYKSCICGEKGTDTFEYGNLVSHTMTSVVENDYLKTAATCVDKAIYYKSCSVCGAKDTTTFEYGEVNLNNHIGEESTTYEKSTSSVHIKKITCDVCNQLKSSTNENHTMNTQNTCTLCEQHNHNYNQQVASSTYLKSAATCTAKAVYYKTCVCGEKGTTTFESGTTISHNMTNIVDATCLKEAATCISKNIYYKSCSVCGTKDTVTFENGSVNGTNHVGTTTTTYESISDTQHTKKITCDSCNTTKSTTTENHTMNSQNTCTLCNNHVHNYNQQALSSVYLKSEATCTSKALYYYSCVCGTKGTETFGYGVMASHSYTAETTSSTYLKSAATCIAKAVYYKSCISCGATGTTTFEVGTVNANNHAKTTKVKATTASVCWKWECCGAAYDTTHVMVNTGTAGVHQTCSDCGYKTTSHTYNVDSGVQYSAATCTAARKNYQKCSCGYNPQSASYVVSTGLALGHNNAGNVTAQAATCTTAGVVGGTYCTRCNNGKSAAEKTIDALGHNTDGSINAEAATCTTAGVVGGTYCTRCNNGKSDAETTIDALGHTGGVATCTTAKTCTRCGGSYGTINSNNHTGSETYAGTSTVHTKYSCCGATISTTHSYNQNSGVKYSDATCTAKQKNYKSCACGYNPRNASYLVEVGSINTNNHSGDATYGGTLNIHTKCNECNAVISSNHTYTSSIVAEATCTSMGSTKYVCACGYGYTIQNIDALGHIDADNNNVCDRCGLIIKFVEGLGDVGINGDNIKNPEDVEIEYDSDNGNVSVMVPPSDEPETLPEIPEENLAEIIEFGNGRFDTSSTYIPGTYETVPYEYTYTVTKYPVSYHINIWSAFLVTKDQDDNIINTTANSISLSDIDKAYSTYVVYCFSNDRALSFNGVKGETIELYTISNPQDDTLDEAIYLAGVLSLSDDREYHVAKLIDGTYVHQNVDDKISEIHSLCVTYTVKGNIEVEIEAPSMNVNQIYVPIGNLKAEEGMTWREWLDSKYNTTGLKNPSIKTSDFADVSLDDEIVAGGQYALSEFTLSGVWTFNDFVTPWDGLDVLINFTSAGEEFVGLMVISDSTIDYIYPEDAYDFSYFAYERYPVTSSFITSGWFDSAYQTIDFGSSPQPVSREFYEWFISNAKQEGVEYIKGYWMFNDEINLQILDDICLENWLNNGEDDDAWRFDIDFVSNGQHFEYMATGDGTIATIPCAHGYEMLYGNKYNGYIWSYAFNDGEGVDPAGNIHAWSDEAYRIVDFGSIPKAVPIEFYQWLLENAQPCLSGAYKLNDNLYMYALDEFSIAANGNFTSGKEYFSSISINQVKVGYRSQVVIKYGNQIVLDQLYDVFATETQVICTYPNPCYQTVNFGANIVPVSYEFYEWFNKNTRRTMTELSLGMVTNTEHTDENRYFMFINGMTWKEFVYSAYNRDIQTGEALFEIRDGLVYVISGDNPTPKPSNSTRAQTTESDEVQEQFETAFYTYGSNYEIYYGIGISLACSFDNHPGETFEYKGKYYCTACGEMLRDDGFVPQEISFTINGRTYYAMDGMTWSDWVKSKYNTSNEQYSNFSIDESSFIYCIGDLRDDPMEQFCFNIKWRQVVDNLSDVLANEYIIPGYNYVAS